MKKFFTLLAMMVMFAFSSQATYYLVGNEPFGHGWDPSNGLAMTDNGDGSYSFSATINGSIWFVMADDLAAANDWTTFNNTMRIGPTGGDETVTAGTWMSTQKSGGDHGAYKFTGSGEEYKITYIPAISKFMIEGNVEEIPITVYTVAGEPTSVFGTSWDPTNTDNDMTLLENGLYELDKYNCELAADAPLLFKVVGNRDWGTCWPEENFSFSVEQSGVYNLRFTFDPNTKFIGVQASLVGEFTPRTGDLFILGEVNGNAWSPMVGLQMTTEDQNIYKASFFTNGENLDETDNIGYSFFSFTSKLAESEDWGSIAGYRLGGTVDGLLVSEDLFGVELPLAGFGQTGSFKLPAGQYEATVNLDAMTLVITKAAAPEPTDPPVITYEVTDDNVIITVTGEGEIHVYVDGVEVENPYVIPRGDEDVTVIVTATAQGDGKEISETATSEIVVPAKAGEPEDGYKIEKLWEITDLSFMTTADVRQGFGMNGMFYINDKANQKVIVVGEGGLADTEYPGGANCGITRDEAGNLVISNAHFPDAWTAESTIKVVNPVTNEVKEYVVPEECGMAGRCDFIGFAKGNLMEDGVIYLTGATNSGVSVMTIAGGEVNTDECYPAACDGLTPSTSTVINFFKDLAGEDALIYVTRNAALQKLAFEDEAFTATAFTLPNKGACNGTFPFVWDGKEFFVYPTLPNYQNGFAVAEASAEAPIVEVESTVTGNANTFTSNWLNAEVGENEVIIYQYYPGGNITVYRLTKVGGGIEELINDTEKEVANVRYYNIMGQEMLQADGLTIIVTTYTDGSSKAVKVLK